MTHEELENLSMPELAERARRAGFESVAHMHPEELIEAIQEHLDFTRTTQREGTIM